MSAHRKTNAANYWRNKVSSTIFIKKSRRRRTAILLFGVAALLLAFAGSALAVEDGVGAPAAPWITSDKADYAPGELVTLTGGSWGPGESVHIYVEDDQGKTWSRDVDVVAGEDGSITDQFNLPNWFVATYHVTATGALSDRATTTFTDGNLRFRLATAGTAIPSESLSTFEWTVAYDKWGQGNVSNTTCTGARHEFGSIEMTGDAGDNVGINGNQSAKPTSVTAPAGYEFDYWSATATSTAALTGSDLCAAGSNGSATETFFAHFKLADSTAPAITLDAPADDSFTNDTTPTFSGTAGNATGDSQTVTVKVYEGQTTSGTLLRTLSTTRSGTSWTVDLPATQSLSAGVYTTQATQTDTANNTGTSSANTFTIDTTKPEITASATTVGDGLAYTAGTWTKQSVAVDFSCADVGTVQSGIETDTVAGQTLNGDTETGSVTNTGVCTDRAGNSADPETFEFIKIDKTAPNVPTASASAGGASYTVNTWTKHTVTVSFVSNGDSGAVQSGGVTCSANQTFENETATGSAAGVCTDAAGNTSSTTTFSPIKIDKTDPVITFKDRTAANDAGWNNTNVVVRWDCADALSGAVDAIVSQTLTAEGADQEATGTCHDAAGNSASDTVTDIDIDKTKPTNVQFVGEIGEGDSFYFGSVPNSPTCTAEDALSLLDSCTVSGHTTTVGTHTLIATATDNAGNSETANRVYTVLPWSVSGYYTPIDMGGLSIETVMWNTAKAGSTVPLKFEIFAGPLGINELTDVSFVDMSAKKAQCASGTEDTIETLAAAGSTSLRYDWSGGQFIYNWKTPTPAQYPACYAVTAMTDDGSSITAYVKLKK
jgi:hypothetical protein